MKYFRNSELVQLYGVSDKAIRNWIEGTRQGKVDLDLLHSDGRTYVADNLHNTTLLKELAEHGKKYRNSRTFKRLAPSQEFYHMFSASQVTHIANALEVRSEIPGQYILFGRNATAWDAYLQKLYSSGQTNLLTASLQLVNRDIPYLDDHLEQYQHVNIISVGAGNGLAARRLVYHLLASGKLRRCVGVDDNRNLLNITERNYRDWFGQQLQFEKHVVHDGFEELGGLLHTDTYNDDAAATTNIILCLGGMLSSSGRPDGLLDTMTRSLGKHDLLIVSDKLSESDTQRLSSRTTIPDFSELSSHARALLTLLGIEGSSYDIEQTPGTQPSSFLLQARFKSAVSIELQAGDFRKMVEFDKGEAIVLWRELQLSDQQTEDMLRRNGLNILRMSKTADAAYIYLVAKAKLVRCWPRA